MDWQKTLTEIWHVLRDHWIQWLGSFILLGLGSWWGKRRARSEWGQKRFLHRLNISLNMFQDGHLYIRTLLEEDSEAVFLNHTAVALVEAAAHKTTAANPILPLHPDERWYLLNSVLNEISEKFAEGYIKRDLGLPVTAANYLVCLTYENAGELRTRKIRAMVIRKEVLLSLPEKTPNFEKAHHATRYETLKILKTVYQKDTSHFLEAEICI